MSKRQKEVEGSVDIEALMEKHGDNIVRLCYLYLRDGALAEDATQETFVRAVLGLPGKYR